jgi:hypothetical protein
MVDPKIFESLQLKIDEDAEVRDQIRTILQTLERQGRVAQSILSRAHSTPAAHRKLPILPHGWNMANKPTVEEVIKSAEDAIKEQIASVGKLAEITSNTPYYKYNGLWTRDVQNVIYSILFCGWLGGIALEGAPAATGKLFTIEEVGNILNGMSSSSLRDLLLICYSAGEHQRSRRFPHHYRRIPPVPYHAH